MVDVYPIHLHLQNFLGTHEPYFSHSFFQKIDISMSLCLLGIGIISFGSPKLKLRHFNAKLVGMPSSLGYLLLHLDSTLFSLSNDTKITQNGIRMKKLRSKQNRVAKMQGVAKKKFRNRANFILFFYYFIFKRQRIFF